MKTIYSHALPRSPLTAAVLPEVRDGRVVDGLAVLQPLDSRGRGTSDLTHQLDAFVQEDPHLAGELGAGDTGRDWDTVTGLSVKMCNDKPHSGLNSFPAKLPITPDPTLT